MVNRSPGCFGHYDFDHIADFAKNVLLMVAAPLAC